MQSSSWCSMSVHYLITLNLISFISFPCYISLLWLLHHHWSCHYCSQECHCPLFCIWIFQVLLWFLMTCVFASVNLTHISLPFTAWQSCFSSTLNMDDTPWIEALTLYSSVALLWCMPPVMVSRSQWTWVPNSLQMGVNSVGYEPQGTEVIQYTYHLATPE